MTQQDPQRPEISVLLDPSRADLRSPGQPRPVRIYRWRPDLPAGEPAPLVLVSHGTGGSGSAMGWLAGPLTAAGFEVVAVDHHGNNFLDGYEPEGFLFVWDRPLDLSLVLDALAAEGPLGPVGAVGFSLGGYSAAALAGARLDGAVLRALYETTEPLDGVPEFPDVVGALRAKVSDEELAARAVEAVGDYTDPRVRAVFQICPAIGHVATVASLREITVPVEIRWGGADTVTPYELDVRPYLEHVPTAHGRSAGPAVRHDDFYAEEPADPTARPRTAAEAVAFFTERLGAAGRDAAPAEAGATPG
ncbi:alpha/beta hydrolase [Streptomyces sp. DSM 44915]|uniref:Alpha/beta hydrolase n=1 Tax=Streptomyces chisholmiae TaxID=3075540 RepID=A0ABU2JPP1_9ACTN|nr:alpha/beta hydrolase [Streptomyces sp. DSM 44915]MDT0266479.1 alpha/beta hydrolase [Streptomyces sp. DSM 44915]